MSEQDTARPLPRVGESATRAHNFTPEMVRQYADLVGDHNPLHLDAKYAMKTQFGRPIVHGMFVAGLISAILGEELPGEGAIYLSQSLRFVAPVYVGDTVTGTVTVTAVRAEKRLITLKTECVNTEGARVLIGEATVKLG